MDRNDRLDVEAMISTSVLELEKRIELKIDLIIQMLKTNESDQSVLKDEQILHKERLNNMDIQHAKRQISCPYAVRIDNLEKKIDKLIYKTSIYTGLFLGLVYFFAPVILDWIKNIFG